MVKTPLTSTNDAVLGTVFYSNGDLEQGYGYSTQWSIEYYKEFDANICTDTVSDTSRPSINATTPDRRRSRTYAPGAMAMRARQCRVWLTTYKVLFMVVVAANISTMLLVVVGRKHGLRRGPPEKALTGVAANILAAVLIRQEDVLNLLYKVCTLAPLGAPFALRRHLANVHHFGGVHSGCAVSAVAWYIAYMTLTAVHFKLKSHPGALHIVDLTAGGMVLVLFFAIVVTSLPSLRRRHHNVFERTHRFAGWAAILALWVHAIITYVHGAVFYSSPTFYLLALTTALLILPWLRIRKVRIEAVHMSSREITLKFPYTDLPAVSTMRFSLAPLVEWHGFAPIRVTHGTGTGTGTGTEGPSSSTTAAIIVSGVGDWTKSVVRAPPTHLWLRNPPTHNFLTGVCMFSSVLLVMTGAGIGPVLSLLASIDPKKTKTQFKILWCVKDPHATHWEFAVNAIMRVDREPHIWDSMKGRPDLLYEARQMVDRFKLEAVFVVSGQENTERIVEGVRSPSVASYGAIFDS